MNSMADQKPNDEYAEAKRDPARGAAIRTAAYAATTTLKINGIGDDGHAALTVAALLMTNAAIGAGNTKEQAFEVLITLVHEAIAHMRKLTPDQDPPGNVRAWAAAQRIPGDRTRGDA